MKFPFCGRFHLHKVEEPQRLAIEETKSDNSDHDQISVAKARGAKGAARDRVRSHSRPVSEVSDESHESSGIGSTDDLEWAPVEGDPKERKPTLAASVEAHRSMSRRITDGRSFRECLKTVLGDLGDVPDGDSEVEEPPSHRVQVLFDDGWRDFESDEGRQVCNELASGSHLFQLTLRGHEYRFDFTDFEHATQTNIKTGKRRRLRLLDAPVGEDGNNVEHMQGRLPTLSQEEVEEQVRFGPQSKRGNASQHPIGKYLSDNEHARSCFDMFAKNEQRYCGEWAVFYHSYSFAALIYEVHAAVASVLFRFRSQYAALPRILVHEFHDIPDATTLIQRFNSEFAENKRDHNPAFRKVGISAMSSLVSTGPEACTARVFVSGYSCKDIQFNNVLERVLEALHVPKEKVPSLATKIIKLSEKHGLDVSQFGGKPCKSQKAGHLLQIFIKRHLVDEIVYAAEPYGPLDVERMPVSKWANSNTSFSRGQVRIVAHPKLFMQANCVRMHVASADPTFHNSRKKFQEELCALITELGTRDSRESAATCIWGGTLPSWWCSEDQRQVA